MMYKSSISIYKYIFKVLISRYTIVLLGLLQLIRSVPVNIQREHAKIIQTTFFQFFILQLQSTFLNDFSLRYFIQKSAFSVLITSDRLNNCKILNEKVILKQTSTINESFHARDLLRTSHYILIHLIYLNYLVNKTLQLYNALDLKPFFRYLCYIKCKRTCLLACHLLSLFKRCISNERFVICKDHLSHLYS